MHAVLREYVMLQCLDDVLGICTRSLKCMCMSTAYLIASMSASSGGATNASVSFIRALVNAAKHSAGAGE